MKLLHRRIVYIFFIAVFLIATPLIVLYTMGYRYNFDKGRVQKTGIIRLTSDPRGADIYLNGVKYDLSQTPARIEKLLPGDYEIKLSKDGFYDWQKKLPVYENGTTFAEKIILWKKSAPTLLATSTAVSWLVSPDKNIIALADDSGNIKLLDINSGIFGEISGGKTEIIATIAGAGSLRLMSFSPSGRYILTAAAKNGKTSHYLIDTLAKNGKKLPGQDYIGLKWEASTDNLYALDKAGLWSVNLSSLKAQMFLKGLTADDFYLAGKNLYFIAAGTLNKQTLGNSNASEIEKLTCSDCRIQDIKSNRLIAGNDSGELAIIDLNRRTKTVKAKADKLDWLNPNSLIFYNDHEIYIYDLAKSDPELITRLSTAITSAIWHPNGKDLVFSADNKIKIIELDNRELRNTVEIAPTAALYMALDRSGDNLYYSTGESGIFKLNIR